MNYGKKKAAKRQKQITSKSAMQAKRVGVRLFKALLLCIIVVAIAGVAGGGLFVKKIIDNSPDITPDDVKPQGFTTLVYADDGTTEIERFVAAGSNRVYKTIDEIPADLQHAFVAIEDERFYEHNGIDIKGIVRAGVSLISGGSQGASTLTQQLIKNNVFPNFVNEKTFYDKLQRKLQEQFLAVSIEKQMSKDEIMEAYLNTINLGQNCLGVQSAAKRYFNKDVSELTLSESAVIAGITQSPGNLNPITNPQKNQKRRDKVLKNMLKQGYIDQAAYDEAMADDVYARIQSVNETQTDSSNAYSYFVDALADQVMNDLQDQCGFSETQAYNAVYSGGLSIYSTQNQSLQQICDEEANDDSNYPGLKEYGLDYALTVQSPDGKQTNYSKEMLQLYFRDQDPEFDLLFDSPEEGQQYVDQYKANILADGSTVVSERVNFAPQPQSSMTVIDQHTGYVKALIGGRGEKTASLTLNRATDTTRQPGSTFKIVSTYAPALNEKGDTLATTFMDEPYEYPDGSPVNNASRSYGGETTIRKAIQNSINVVAVKCLEQVTPALGLKYLDDFGFTTLAHGTEADKDANGNIWSDANLATALGGITKGVKNVELCAAYAAIANGGNYIKPIYYTQILDHDGNVLIENSSVSRSVIKDSTAYLLTSAMEDVVKKGTGTACQLDNMTVAGKTGTTEDYNDLWFVGYTPYYTCAVWSGYDNNEKIPEDARNFHKNLWKKVMTRIHEGLEDRDFDMPSSVEKASVCAETGLLPRSGCPTITEYFDISSLPTEYCDQHFYGSSDYDEEDYYYNEDTDADTDAAAEAIPSAAPDSTDSTDTDNTDNSDDGSDNTGDDTDNSGTDDNTGGDDGSYDNSNDTGGDDTGEDPVEYYE